VLLEEITVTFLALDKQISGALLSKSRTLKKSKFLLGGQSSLKISTYLPSLLLEAFSYQVHIASHRPFYCNFRNLLFFSCFLHVLIFLSLAMV
jgi:hypothetical protein